jgi:alkyl hydroperoxide reductase subunit AhpF
VAAFPIRGAEFDRRDALEVAMQVALGQDARHAAIGAARHGVRLALLAQDPAFLQVGL